MSARYVYVSVSVLTSSFTEDCLFKRAMKEDRESIWCPEHEEAFTEINKMIAEVPGPVLQYYDPSKSVRVQIDASQSGLGAVVMQNGQPIAYASKSLTTMQQAYAQIEKETLTLVFGCEKFHHYLYGRNFVAETDHKPLEIIIKKPSHLVPMRLQRIRIQYACKDITSQSSTDQERVFRLLIPCPEMVLVMAALLMILALMFMLMLF